MPKLKPTTEQDRRRTEEIVAREARVVLSMLPPTIAPEHANVVVFLAAGTPWIDTAELTGYSRRNIGYIAKRYQTQINQLASHTHILADRFVLGMVLNLLRIGFAASAHLHAHAAEMTTRELRDLAAATAGFLDARARILADKTANGTDTGAIRHDISAAVAQLESIKDAGDTSEVSQ